MYVANYTSGDVTVIDGATNTPAAGSPVATGAGAAGCGVDTVNNRAFISNDAGGTVTFINGANNSVIKSVATGANPSIHTWDNAANLVIVGNYGSGTISLFDLDTLADAGTITVGINPWTSFIDLGVRAIHVTNRGSNSVSIIDMHDWTVKQTIPVGTAPQGIARYYQNFYIVNQGNGTSGSVSVYKRPDFRHSWDLGDDGRADLVWRNGADKSLAAWLMNGTAATSAAYLLGPSDWVPVVRADLDGDGKSDIVFRNTVTQQTAAWFMDGLTARPGMAGVILGPSSYTPIGAIGCAGATARCLVWRDPVGGSVVYWYMNMGLTPSYTQTVFSGGPNWLEPLFGNFDGDFWGDLLWQHTDGTVAIWLMSSNATAFTVKSSGVIMGPGTGWGGRFADKLVTANAGQLIPSAVSVSGSQLYTMGTATAPLVVPSNGGVAVSGQGTDAVSVARYNALVSLLKNANPANQVVVGAAGVMDKALTANATANPILTATLPTQIQTAFTVNGALLNTGIAQQLRQVARLIDGRAATGVKRQVFFVSMGGFDTHSNTVTNQTNLFNQLFPAMKAFYDYTVAAGVSNDVVQVTMSDFNRTFIGNANSGVDHAWGGHQILVGGSVKGGAMYGTFPDLLRGGTMDSGNNGAWIPQTAVDQVGGTLGKWLGMPGSDISQVFPNLANFATPDLGFMV